MIQTSKKFYRPKEIEAELSVSKSTVARMMRDGQLPRVKVRGCVRIPAEAVERIKEGRKM